LTFQTDAVATAVAGGALPTCPADLATCQSDLGTCQADLATCLATPQGQLLKTGQTQCWDSGGGPIACAGTGQDGELQKGLARAYVDNGDGTITGTNTGLTWEKLSDDGSIHDEGNFYPWNDAFAVKVATLNTTAFAGHTDWRVPNQFELYSLVNLGAENPAMSSAFNMGCVPGCTVLRCSCPLTESVGHWSSSAYQPHPQEVWEVIFFNGSVGISDRPVGIGGNIVRAVRGGS
jgi:Protein of unknown function (DUF1566)